MFKTDLNNLSFVCLSDLLPNTYREYNPVVFNPKATNEENGKKIKEVAKKYFNVILGDSDINQLLQLEPGIFISRFKYLVSH